jgi:2-haloalkanoic acid dehalogenase type II
VNARYDAVLFDLLTGLLDSWTLWDQVAGSSQLGLRWRKRYLEITYATGAYRPYEVLVREAAEQEGLPAELGARLEASWDALAPWPEANAVLNRLRASGLPLGVVTNCSEVLGRQACARLSVPFKTIVTAERAGFYKPHERPYRLALEELGVAPERTLFVAGSMFDLVGTSRVGLPSFWHNRIGLIPPPGHPSALIEADTLEALPGFVLEGME